MLISTLTLVNIAASVPVELTSMLINITVEGT